MAHIYVCIYIYLYIYIYICIVYTYTQIRMISVCLLIYLFGRTSGTGNFPRSSTSSLPLPYLDAHPNGSNLYKSSRHIPFWGNWNVPWINGWFLGGASPVSTCMSMSIHIIISTIYWLGLARPSEDRALKTGRWLFSWMRRHEPPAGSGWQICRKPWLFPSILMAVTIQNILEVDGLGVDSDGWRWVFPDDCISENHQVLCSLR